MIAAKTPARRAHRKKIAGAKLHARLQQRILHGRNPRGTAQESIEGGDLAELLVAQQGEFFVRIALRRLLHRGQTISDQAGLSAPFIEQRNDGEGRERNHDEHEKRDQDCGHRFNSNCRLPIAD